MEGQNERKGYPVTASGYELLEEIGQGVSATVYRALCLPFNEVVAIKSLDLEKCISNLDGIRREAQMMSLISHPNVVKAYCSFVVEQTLWVVMPYMAGGSCLHIMKAAHPDGFDEPVIATVLKAALKALEYLHRHGHIHRDVKAGNILVDEKGVIKLGDFGVSACMFDTGDRQRSRNTFVGTPCWMAPEVMEQLHGYDFKADIWSFGITGLELAHGHAPFSKYPPMKVLLMTLQNAPPGLDYERDKKFSKLFKEMIAMCLVKDPAKRPSAEKLLKHSFFKHARNYEYIARHVLDGLPSLGDRVTTLKLKDAVRLAQKKMPSGEWEERSQNEYKRGVSSWNFNVEDLKAQADMIEDDDGSAAGVKEDKGVFKVRDHRKEDNEVSKVREGTEIEGWTTDVCQPVNAPLSSDVRNLERPELSCTAPSSKGNTTSPPSKGNATSDAGERVIRTISRSESMASPLRRTNNLPIRSSSIGKRELKHLARFNIFGSASDLLESVKGQEKDLGDERQTVRRDDGAPGRGAADRDGGTDKPQTGSEERESRQGVRPSEDLTRTKSQFWERGTVTAPVSSTGSKEALDEKPKAGIIQKKGRFSVTSEVVGTDTSTEKEREHLQQITELQTKVASLVDELQAVKLRNAELERQLSSTPMEERIHRK